MMTIPTPITLCAMLFVCASAAAPAADGEARGPDAARMIERMDGDDDGRVSRSEFREAWERRMERRFERMDANGDGQLTAEEVSAARQHRKRRRDRKEHSGG